MYLTLLGILTEDKFLQLENTHPPIVSTLSPSSTVFRQDNLSFSFVGYTCGNKRETIYIPNSVRFIGYNTFTGAKNIKNVYVNNTMPPVLNGSFDSSVKKEGTLYVPKGSYNNYWLADKWGDFINIIETDIPTSNEIVSHSNEYEIQTISNGILVCTNKPINVSIYNIHGQILVNKTISGGKVINLPKGIYIVSADNKTHKIIIK